MLTHHDVERIRGKGQRHGIAFAPFHGWFPSTGKREHGAVEVEPNDMSSCPYVRGSLSGDHSGAAGHIEHAFTGLRRHEIEESWYPRSKHGGHHVTLINVGGRFSCGHSALANPERPVPDSDDVFVGNGPLEKTARPGEAEGIL